jgi:hypothetical protein
LKKFLTHRYTDNRAEDGRQRAGQKGSPASGCVEGAVSVQFERKH